MKATRRSKSIDQTLPLPLIGMLRSTCDIGNDIPIAVVQIIADLMPGFMATVRSRRINESEVVNLETFIERMHEDDPIIDDDQELRPALKAAGLDADRLLRAYRYTHGENGFLVGAMFAYFYMTDGGVR